MGSLGRGLMTVVVAVACLAPAPSRAATTKYETSIVPTRHGDVFVRIWRPSAGRHPVVLTYSPYDALENDPGDNSPTYVASNGWVDEGFVYAYADVVGTGNSGGCYDYGGRREKESGYDLVEWLARQPWSTGKIGMEGGSYDGTTAIATAVMHPPHLRTIIPIAAIVRWYDYAYSGGWRYSDNGESLGHEGPGAAGDEGIDTPIGFDFGLAVPPPLDPTDTNFAQRFTDNVKPCDEIAHTQHGYSETPDYDAFWLERDYLKDAGKLTIPVLVAANWGDYNVKQEESVLLYSALTHSKARRLFMGTRWHGHGSPGGLPEVEWMTRWLMGRGLGDRIPAVTSQTADSTGIDIKYSGVWPATSDMTIVPSGASSVALTDVPRTEWTSLVSPATQPGVLWVQTPPLTKDVRVFGSPSVRLAVSTNRPWITAAMSIADVDPARYSNGVATDRNQLIAVTRGWLDSRYRDGLAHQAQRQPTFTMTVRAKPVDYIFHKGHSIGLLVQTQEAEWVVPKSPPTCACANISLVLGSGKTNVRIPIVLVSNPARRRP